jgi:hypothetical protein
MNRRAQIGRLLQRYGDLVEIRGEERALQVNAWIQPLRYKNKMYLGGTYLPDGYLDGGHFLYLGPAETRLDQMPSDTVLSRQGVRYMIQRVEPVWFANEILYIWAILQICGEENL